MRIKNDGFDRTKTGHCTRHNFFKKSLSISFIVILVTLSLLSVSFVKVEAMEKNDDDNLNPIVPPNNNDIPTDLVEVVIDSGSEKSENNDNDDSLTRDTDYGSDDPPENNPPEPDDPPKNDPSNNDPPKEENPPESDDPPENMPPEDPLEDLDDMLDDELEDEELEDDELEDKLEDELFNTHRDNENKEYGIVSPKGIEKSDNPYEMNFIPIDKKQKTEVINIEIEGSIYYLLDTDNDGELDIFYNPYKSINIPLEKEDSCYVIDLDGDGERDYKYDPVEGTVKQYGEKGSEDFSRTLSIFFLMLAAILVTILCYWIYHDQKKLVSKEE